MVQSRRRQRFLFKPVQPFGVQRKRLRQDLDRHLALQSRIARPIDLAHSPGSQQADNFIRPKFRPRSQFHAQPDYKPAMWVGRPCDERLLLTRDGRKTLGTSNFPHLHKHNKALLAEGFDFPRAREI